LYHVDIYEPQAQLNHSMIELLEQFLDGTPEDKSLCKLLTIIANESETSSAYRRAVSRLISKAQKIPGLLKSSHSNYPSALNLTWEWLAKNIKKFEPGTPSIQRSLLNWINGYLYWRIKDLYLQDENYIPLDRRLSHGELGNDEITFADIVSNTDSNTPALKRRRDTGDADGLDIYIRKLQDKEIKKFWLKLEDYINKDPQGKLRNCHPRDCEKCNCKFLAERLLLKEAPDDFQSITEQVGINYQTVYSRWNRECKLLLVTISLEIGYIPGILKQYIEEDKDGLLKKCCKYDDACNAQFLAMQLLPEFQNPPKSFDEIAQNMQNQGIKKITTEKIKDFWEQKSLPLLSKINFQLQKQLKH
jgi:hypothetical protein